MILTSFLKFSTVLDMKMPLLQPVRNNNHNDDDNKDDDNNLNTQTTMFFTFDFL